MEAKTKDLKAKLPKEANINFSVQDKKIYWFGYVETTSNAFNATYEQLLKSEDFGVLKKRTLLHLRFFLNNQKAIDNQILLLKKINELANKISIKLSLNGTP
jgi:hypothetical protein